MFNKRKMKISKEKICKNNMKQNTTHEVMELRKFGKRSKMEKISILLKTHLSVDS